ncbi:MULTISPECIES: hypothetical protein [unclassified Ensifer]|uniref:hypothetical protein n=1 Tax=unclassified Ensifer TaxID=2633371 RepID=UPI00070C03F4|nr:MULTISPECIES: hypothetical protein [unclassified Ensifer]KQW41102.1 hypothetical protein ASD02_36200 [Ensifer sp. Root1252]KRC62227.1 hypothetical protein ASE32_36295 [Ensifer sp. Root231]KRC91127.1 hypothetical protein ASE47_36265 [Ensifer sp. Root258]
MDGISISYAPEDAYHGKLTVSVQSMNFSGRSSAWFNLEQVSAFADALGAVPIEIGAEPVLQGGIWREGALDQTHVSLRFVPHNLTGTVRVECLLAVPLLVAGAPSVLSNTLKVSLLTTYSDLQRFQMELHVVLRGEGGNADLRAEEG